MTIPAGLQWELIVVDNNSTDDTRLVSEEFSRTIPVRYVFEGRQGKGHALNRGIEEARGGLLVFTDDDVSVDAKWVASYLDAARKHSNASFFGGRVLDSWESPPPKWVENSMRLLPMNVHVDRGAVGRFLKHGENPFFVGANFCCRKSVFDSGVMYRNDGSPAAEDYIPGEDNVLQQELLAHGFKGFYEPAAIVFHRHAASRQTERYLRRYHRGYGVAEVRNGEILMTNLWFGVPRYCWRAVIINAIKYLAARWCAPSRVWITAEANMAQTWGKICECRRIVKRRRTDAV